MSSYRVICAACGTTNRIPAEKEGVAGRCGQCQAVLPLLFYRPQPLTTGTFDAFVRNYPGPVLAEFWAGW